MIQSWTTKVVFGRLALRLVSARRKCDAKNNNLLPLDPQVILFGKTPPFDYHLVSFFFRISLSYQKHVWFLWKSLEIVSQPTFS